MRPFFKTRLRIRILRHAKRQKNVAPPESKLRVDITLKSGNVTGDNFSALIWCQIVTIVAAGAQPASLCFVKEGKRILFSIWQPVKK